ncbi:MAG TPA: amidohydrolase family protein [Candidatus Bathyarchaeia archaeon]|nr:amidohydrolase family protein [Candidatus Bathyarchaeia archaeon]
MIVDFHNHFYPKSYMNELKKQEGYARSSTDDQGRLLIQYTGDYNVVADSHVNLGDRLKAIDKAGIDMQVLTLTTPGVERETSERGIKLSRLANDEFGQIKEKYPDRFTALATLPVQEPEAAVTELERAVKECGLPGALLFSNTNGRSLDSKEYMPLYEKAVKLDVPLFIHPTTPINYAAMEDYRLVPIMGFTVDTTLAVLRLVFSGVLKRLPNLKLVASHLGGVFPYLRGRIEIAYKAYPECKVNISEPPSFYLKKIWADSVCYNTDVFMSTYAFSGAEKLVLGTDFPHEIHDLYHAVERIKSLKITEEQKEMILGENAAKLLKL